MDWFQQWMCSRREARHHRSRSRGSRERRGSRSIATTLNSGLRKALTTALLVSRTPLAQSSIQLQSALAYSTSPPVPRTLTDVHRLIRTLLFSEGNAPASLLFV